MSTPRRLVLRLLDPEFAVVRMSPTAGIPAWADGAPFASITRTPAELSLMLPAARVPATHPPDTIVRDGWRLLALEGPIAFSAIGVTRDLVTPLAAAGISILPVATFDTDYLLVPGAQLDDAVAALRTAGHTVVTSIREP